MDPMVLLDWPRRSVSALLLSPRPRPEPFSLLMALSLAVAGVAGAGAGGPVSGQSGGGPGSGDVPLYDGLGDHHHEITTGVAEAQTYFDQGVRLTYAFNHAEAVRSFREGARLDPDCAMCWWGVALANGPNINAAMDSASGAAAWEAVQKARRAAERADVSERERAFVEAVAERYGPDPLAERAARDSAWARAMGEVASRFPGSDDALTLHGEALMLLSPWDYWTDDEELRPHMRAALDNFRTVMERNPEHPGACHLFIHSVEAVRPEWALPCAERLPDLMPAAGHIVHMPAHVYIRVGRYNDAIETNVHAARADRTMIDDLAPDGVYRLGYVPHNHHFLWFAAEMAGRWEEAIEGARRTADLVDRELMDEPGLMALQHYLVTPLFTRVRFGRWDEVLRSQRPSELPYPSGVWRYARALAFAGRGDLDAAREERRALDRIRSGHPELEDRLIWEINSAAAVLEIASTVVAAKIATVESDLDEAIRHLRKGVELEDALLYDEPPTWHLPVRHRLGAVLLEAGRYEEAEEVYREDLRRFPENGWSLYGLAEALRAQDRDAEAHSVERRFEQAWAEADVELEASRF